jgi:hypothetical protein
MLLLAVTAYADTIQVPPVVISELNHEYYYNSWEDATSIYDGVTFLPGEGGFSGPGFTATIGQGDHVITRFEAPEGCKFVVIRHPDATQQDFHASAFWHTGLADISSHTETPTVTYENMTGPLPQTTYQWDCVYNAGQVVEVEEGTTIQGAFEFTAMQIEFTATYPLERLERIYGPVKSHAAPSYASTVYESGVIPDQTIMAIVPIGSGAIEGTMGREAATILVLPNPVAGNARICFAARAAGPVQVAIHDVGGRCVAEWVEQASRPGPLWITWNGTGVGGSRLATGLYFVDVRNGGARAVERLVIAR